MRAIFTTLMATLLAAGAMSAVHAQDNTMDMTTREDFVQKQCVPAMRKQFGTDNTAAAFAKASCECSYRLLADRKTITRDQFDAAGVVCQAEFAHDPEAFVGKYNE